MGRFVHCNVQYLYFYFLMNHCNDFAPCGPSIGQYKFLFLFFWDKRGQKLDLISFFNLIKYQCSLFPFFNYFFYLQNWHHELHFSYFILEKGSYSEISNILKVYIIFVYFYPILTLFFQLDWLWWELS